MINGAIPPGNSPLDAAFNMLTFAIGSLFSLNQIAHSTLVKISFSGASEVLVYGALGGIASLTAKLLVEFCIKEAKEAWKSFKK